MEWWRKQGAKVDKVEYWLPWAKRKGEKGGKEALGIRKDLFGIIDLIVIQDSWCLGIQVTSRTNVGARVTKALGTHLESSELWVSVPSHIFLIEGWHKVGHRWARHVVPILPQSEERLAQFAKKV